MQKKRQKKIAAAQKIVIIMAVIMMAINGVTMHIIRGVMEKTMIETERKYLSEIVKNIGNTAHQTVFEYVSVCDVLAKNTAIIEVLRDSDKENPMETHPLSLEAVAEMTHVFEAYDGKIMSMAIFDIEQDAYLLNTGVASGEDFSFQTRPYYEPVHTGKHVVTVPYLDVLTDGLVVTIASPVFYEGEVIGVVGLDLPIDFMSHLVVESSYGDSGRSLVMDKNNTILAYADPSYINENYTALNITGLDLEQELNFPTGNLVEYEMEGHNRMGLVVEVDSLDWKVLTAMDYAEFDQISSVIAGFLVLSGLFTLLSCGYFISGKFSQTMIEMHQRDPLTGLYNRMGFNSIATETMKNPPTNMGVLSVNINGLKQINENDGTAGGDKHIKNCASRLQEHFGYEFYRMSGDEMVGLANNVAEETFQQEVITLRDAMKEENNYDFSFGHAWGKGNYDLWKLMQEADTVMYINKQEYYSSSDRKFDSVNHSVLADLLSYLEQDEFMIYLQPQVHLSDGSLYGAEALIRRYDKTNKKMVFPDQFIPLYEQKSIIRHVDIFVVETVCRLLQTWVAKGKGIPISVNLSRVTLLEYGIVDTIAEICDQYDVPHKLLVIEVTERVGLIENNVASSLILDFKERGFHISLDDFGCAYSNIVTLAQIDVDEVKIDKSLVDNLATDVKNHILVKNVLSMCNELEGTSTLAEGIEDEAQGKLLYELGCTLGQGYFYSRPMPVDDFIKKYID